VRVSEVQTTDRLQMSCEHVSLELRPKTSEAISSAYEWWKTVPNGGGAAWEPTSNHVCRWRLCWQQVRRRWPQDTRLSIWWEKTSKIWRLFKFNGLKTMQMLQQLAIFLLRPSLLCSLLSLFLSCVHIHSWRQHNSVCLSVCASVTLLYCIKTLNISWKFFHHCRAHQSSFSQH